MEKINFKDLPSKDTPIDSKNLNLLQTNVESAINELNSENENTYSLKKEVSNISFNDLMNYGSGLFSLMSSTDNRPPTSAQTNYHFFVIQIKSSSVNFVLQIAKWFFGGPLYMRMLYNGTWQEWEEI